MHYATKHNMQISIDITNIKPKTRYYTYKQAFSNYYFTYYGTFTHINFLSIYRYKMFIIVYFYSTNMYY